MAVDDRSDEHLVASPFAGKHHARYIDERVPLHVISRVFQGRHLLRPCATLNSVIIGVVGRALQRYRDVRLYAMAFLSNHAHFMLQGPGNQVPAFIGFIKREISRRWGHHPSVGWHGTMWDEYIPTALPTAASQVNCLKYILSQGVKEGLVARPEEWPGVHCASSLVSGAPLEGSWFNSTKYSRAVDAQSRRKNPQKVERSLYAVRYDVQFAAIPAWIHLDAAAYRVEVGRLVSEVVAEGERSRAGRRPLGVRRVRRMSLHRRTPLPTVPWLERRRRMICWASQWEPETRAFLGAYWEFQRCFRRAASGTGWSYPSGSHAPGTWIAESERQASA